VPEIAEAEVYVCGPTAWSEAVVRAARRAGVPAARIHEERFSW
jgi:ferredoxin-NADP reductase